MLVSRLCPVETAYFPIAGVLAHTRQLSWIQHQNEFGGQEFESQGGRGWVATNSGRYGIAGPPGTASLDPR